MRSLRLHWKRTDLYPLPVLASTQSVFAADQQKQRATLIPASLQFQNIFSESCARAALHTQEETKWRLESHPQPGDSGGTVT